MENEGTDGKWNHVGEGWKGEEAVGCEGKLQRKKDG